MRSSLEWQYNFFRTYDPSTGRSLEADPVGQQGLVAWHQARYGRRVELRAARRRLAANLYEYADSNPTKFADPSGLKTTIVITRDWGVGSHSAVHVDNDGTGQPFLYDPGGSFIPDPNSGRGSCDCFTGSEASLPTYSSYQTSTGNTVELYVFDTTPDDEKAMANRAQDLGGIGPPRCAGAVSEVLTGIGPFDGIWSWTPGGLARQLQRRLNELQQQRAQ